MAFTITITNAGRAAIVNAQNTGTAPVTIAQIGLSATAIVPAPTMTALAGELKRTGAIAGDVVADDTIHVTAMDESADVYSLRAFGLYLADGTLFAIYGQAAPILEKVAASIALLSIDVIFADIDAAAITFGDTSFINPPATTERQGVVELATVAEAQAGIDALRALTPAAAKAAILGWLLAQDGSGSGLDADLLDGQHGSYYAPIDSPAFSGVSITINGGKLLVQHDGTNAFIRPTNAGSALHLGAGNTNVMIITPAGGVTIGGAIAWHANNDGSGSGLDADLLDGQHGAYYANVLARLGYTPVNKAGDTMTGNLTVSNGSAQAILTQSGDVISNRGDGTGVVYLGGLSRYLYYDGANYNLPGSHLYIVGAIAWHAGNDGSGSSLDADLLDGQHGSWYADITGRLGYTPLNAASYTAADVLGKLVTVDGSGSGLDADLWRGKTPAQHIADYHSSGSNANGQWRKYPDGAGGFVLEQWGTVDLGTGFNVQYADVTFPTPFSGAAPIHISGNGNKGANAGWNVCSVCFDDPTTGGSRITADSAKSDQYFNRVVTVRWHAIGKAP